MANSWLSDISRKLLAMPALPERDIHVDIPDIARKFSFLPDPDSMVLALSDFGAACWWFRQYSADDEWVGRNLQFAILVSSLLQLTWISSFGSLRKCRYLSMAEFIFIQNQWRRPDDRLPE
ncbi:MAG: hypothetical protein IPK46_10800 [Saprospiraceae bacterium]|nr:hypothetical protein [Saprospiraceae bacterium]